MSELISVVIPAYNAEKAIERCVDSVLNQTYKNLEVIVVDDGSKDKTLEVLRRMEGKDGRVRVIAKKNGGAASARNVGIEAAAGRYIVFIDSDDCIDDCMLQVFCDLQKDSPADCVVCGITVKYEKESYCSATHFRQNTLSQNLEELKSLLLETCENGMIYSPCNKLYDLEIIRRHNIRFPQGEEPIEDAIFNCVYFQHIKTLGTVTDSPYYYVKTEAESNVTRYRERIWEIAKKRSDAFLALFQAVDMGDEGRAWLDREYLGGKADCMNNCYRKGAKLGFKQKKGLFKEHVLGDKRLEEIVKEMGKAGVKSLPYDQKLLAKTVKNGNATLAILTYNFAFFIRRNFKGLYNKIRKRKNLR